MVVARTEGETRVPSCEERPNKLQSARLTASSLKKATKFAGVVCSSREKKNRTQLAQGRVVFVREGEEEEDVSQMMEEKQFR